MTIKHKNCIWLQRLLQYIRRKQTLWSKRNYLSLKIRNIHQHIRQLAFSRLWHQHHVYLIVSTTEINMIFFLVEENLLALSLTITYKVVSYTQPFITIVTRCYYRLTVITKMVSWNKNGEGTPMELWEVILVSYTVILATHCSNHFTCYWSQGEMRWLKAEDQRITVSNHDLLVPFVLVKRKNQYIVSGQIWGPMDFPYQLPWC